MKKYITTISLEKIIVLVFLLFSSIVQAAEGVTLAPLIEIPDEPVDEPEVVVTPIDNYIWVLLLVGLIYVFFTFRALAQRRRLSAK